MNKVASWLMVLLFVVLMSKAIVISSTIPAEKAQFEKSPMFQFFGDVKKE